MPAKEIVLSDDRVRIGDTVNVHFEHLKSISSVIVRAMPVATGDSWILEKYIREIVKNELYYVQNFAYMEKVYG